MSYLLNFLGDLILQPLAPLGVWGFVGVSALLGILLVFVWGLVSNQAGIRLVKRRIYTSLLESILFRHDLRLSLGAQARMLVGGLRYLSYAVPPLLILALPCVLVLTQLYRFYGIEPVAPQQPILVEFKVGEELRGKDIQLEVDGNKALTVGALRSNSNSEYLWKVRPVSEDPINLIFSIEGAPLFAHTLKTKGAEGPVSGKFVQSGAELLMYPTQALDSRVQSVSISYQDAHLPFFGLKVHWVLLFFLISLVAGLLGARLFKVAV